MNIKERIERDLEPQSTILYRCRSDKKFGIKTCENCDSPIREIALKVLGVYSEKEYLLCRDCFYELE
jgi:hypothetical protein